MTLTPQDATAAANSLFGRHPGYRALHAKGTLLKGTFIAAPVAGTLTRAGHMQGEPVPITVRVSNGGGNPNVPDYAPDVRGFAVKFYLPDGSRTDIVAQTSPRFPFHGPEPFVELLRVQRRPAVAWKFPLFLARNPGAIPSLPSFVASTMPPASYATCSYYAIHAYRFVDADGDARHVRYTIRPEMPGKRLKPWEARRRSRDYLQEDIVERVERGTVRFTLEVHIAGGGDVVDDPSSVWADSRERLTVGTFELTGLETDRETGDDVLVFDPSRVVDGIECTDDPVLQYRPKAYDDSVKARTAG